MCVSLIPGVRGTDSLSTFSKKYSQCAFSLYHRQDVPLFNQLVVETTYFLFEKSRVQGRGSQSGGLVAWGTGARHTRAEPRTEPAPGRPAVLVPQSLGLQEQLQQQPWQGLGNLSPASSARPRGVCFSHGPRVGVVGTR